MEISETFFSFNSVIKRRYKFESTSYNVLFCHYSELGRVEARLGPEECIWVFLGLITTKYR